MAQERPTRAPGGCQEGPEKGSKRDIGAHLSQRPLREPPGTLPGLSRTPPGSDFGTNLGQIWTLQMDPRKPKSCTAPATASHAATATDAATSSHDATASHAATASRDATANHAATTSHAATAASHAPTTASPASCFPLRCCAGTVAGFAAGSWIVLSEGI